MPTQPAKRFGDYLSEELESRGWTKQDLALRMFHAETPPPHTARAPTPGAILLELRMQLANPEAPLHEDTARRMGQVFGVEGSFLLRLNALGRGQTPVEESE